MRAGSPQQGGTGLPSVCKSISQRLKARAESRKAEVKAGSWVGLGGHLGVWSGRTALMALGSEGYL